MVVAQAFGVDRLYKLADIIGISISLTVRRAEKLFGRRIDGKEIGIKFILGIILQKPILAGGYRLVIIHARLVEGVYALKRFILFIFVDMRLDLLRPLFQLLPRFVVGIALFFGKLDDRFESRACLVPNENLHPHLIRHLQIAADFFYAHPFGRDRQIKAAVPHLGPFFYVAVVGVIRVFHIPRIFMRGNAPVSHPKRFGRRIDGHFRLFLLCAFSVPRTAAQ